MQRRLAPALGLALVGCALAAPTRPARAQSAPSTAAGFDVAWIQSQYARCLTASFDPADWKRVLGRASQAGARVVRVWILEGAPMQGVQWDAGDAHKPVGVDPALLQNIETVAAIASDAGVQVYWTALDGNVPSVASAPQLEKDRFWNVYNDKYGFGDAWRQNVLGPVVDAIAQRLDVAYGLDILNEVEGPLGNFFFESGWTSASQFVSATAAFVHARAPGLRVSSSAGWGSAPDDILAGRFDGLGLDFLDVHEYTDQGSILEGAALVAHAQQLGLPIVLGELGQLSSATDDALQASVVRGMLQDANRLGFAAALCWRLEDEDPKFTFWNGDSPRPAYFEVKAFTGK